MTAGSIRTSTSTADAPDGSFFWIDDKLSSRSEYASVLERFVEQFPLGDATSSPSGVDRLQTGSFAAQLVSITSLIDSALAETSDRSHEWLVESSPQYISEDWASHMRSVRVVDRSDFVMPDPFNDQA